MEDLKHALWFFVFVFSALGCFQTCVAEKTMVQITRIADQMPLNNLSRKDLAELEFQLQRVADNIGKCGK
jgi:hypothetical protein